MYIITLGWSSVLVLALILDLDLVLDFRWGFRDSNWPPHVHVGFIHSLTRSAIHSFIQLDSFMFINTLQQLSCHMHTNSNSNSSWDLAALGTGSWELGARNSNSNHSTSTLCTHSISLYFHKEIYVHVSVL